MKYYVCIEDDNFRRQYIDSFKKPMEIACDFAESLSDDYNNKIIAISETGFNHNPVLRICVDFARNDGYKLRKFINRLEFD